MIPLRQSTASQEIPLGYFLDSTDGDTEETALTIANTDIKLWKNGAVALAAKNAGGAVHMSDGVYYAALDATDTGTLGPLIIFVHVAGALTARLECVVYPAPVYDALFGSGMSEATGVPPAVTDPISAFALMWAKFRNETTATSSAQTIKNDAGSLIATGTLVDDDTTFTEGKLS